MSTFSVDANESLVFIVCPRRQRHNFPMSILLVFVFFNDVRGIHFYHGFHIAGDGCFHSFFSHRQAVIQSFFLIWKIDRSGGEVDMLVR